MCNSLIYACVTKLTFSLYIIPFVKGLQLIGVNCLFYTFRQGGYIYIYKTVAPVYIYVDMLRVCVFVLFSSVCFTSYMCGFFFVFFFSNEVACAAPKTVIHFLSKVAILFA